jgi:hypothetical protein
VIPFVRSAACARPKRPACKLASRFCAVFLLALTQQGCASLATERALFLEGWHPGRVMRIDVGAAIGPPLRSDCRKAMPLEASSQSHFALVRYSVSASRYAERIAPLTDAAALRVGDRVYVNTKECKPPMKVPVTPQSPGTS